MEKKNMSSAYNQSTEKALDLLEFLANAHEPLRLVDIAKNMGINISTVYRFLNSLIKCGYAAEDPETQRYSLTYKICKLSNTFIRNETIWQVTHPYLLRISREFEESSCISIERNMRAVYIDVVTSHNKVLMSHQYIGNSVPMHSTANGKILLAQYSQEQIDIYIETQGLERFTDYTITTKEALLEELDRVRTNGYAIDDQEGELGVRCLACPIYNYTGKVVAGVSITGPVSRMSFVSMKSRLPVLKKVAYEISVKLGYEG